jgi:nucleotide-binding universal stress UspA family protein
MCVHSSSAIWVKHARVRSPEKRIGLCKMVGENEKLRHWRDPARRLPDSVTEAAVIEKARQEALDRFAVSQTSLGAKGIVVKANVEVSNDVAGAVLEAIEREEADLVVITTHGLSGWYPQVFGSIAEKIVKLAQCPLLLLRTPKPETTAKVPFGRSMEWW